MEELLPVELVAVHLHLCLKLIIEHTEKANTFRDCERPCRKALVEKLDVKKLLLKL